MIIFATSKPYSTQNLDSNKQGREEEAENRKQRVDSEHVGELRKRDTQQGERNGKKS